MLKGIKITTQDKFEVVEYEDKLEVLQQMVGGLIEYVPVCNNIDMIINDEGKLEGLDINPLATILFSYDYIVGDALIVGINDEGENISLTDKEIERILFVIKNNLKNCEGIREKYNKIK